VLSCELAEVCKELKVNYADVLDIAVNDYRLGGTHMRVPGKNGIPGARGSCFPKDISALIAAAEKVGVVPELMKSVRGKNLKIVPPADRDWEKMEGRAVSKP